MNSSIQLLVSNLLTSTIFVVFAPFFHSSKSVCSDYGLYNPLGCYSIFGFAFIIALVANHAIITKVNEGRFHWSYRFVPSALLATIVLF